MFLILGITGHVGGSAARHLLEQGHSVRALVRNPEKATEWAAKGVEIQQGDINDVAALTTALSGVEGVFFLVPPLQVSSSDFPETKALLASFREALLQVAPPKVVALSSIGSEQASGLGLITATYLMEQALGDLPFPVAFVRAAGFLENYLYNLKTADSTGVFDTFLIPTNQNLAFIASEDIGAEVAKLLLDKWSGQKIIELGTSYSIDDLARAMSEVLGKPVEAKLIPREYWESVIGKMGMPSVAAQLYAEMEDAFNSGWISFGKSGAEHVPGTITAVQFFEGARKILG